MLLFSRRSFYWLVWVAQHRCSFCRSCAFMHRHICRRISKKHASALGTRDKFHFFSLEMEECDRREKIVSVWPRLKFIWLPSSLQISKSAAEDCTRQPLSGVWPRPGGKETLTLGQCDRLPGARWSRSSQLVVQWSQRVPWSEAHSRVAGDAMSSPFICNGSFAVRSSCHDDHSTFVCGIRFQSLWWLFQCAVCPREHIPNCNKYAAVWVTHELERCLQHLFYKCVGCCPTRYISNSVAAACVWMFATLYRDLFSSRQSLGQRGRRVWSKVRNVMKRKRTKLFKCFSFRSLLMSYFQNQLWLQLLLAWD